MGGAVRGGKGHSTSIPMESVKLAKSTTPQLLSHQLGKLQCTVPVSCAFAAFHSSAGLKGICGAVWWITVKVDIQKW